ncbi:hypothetical protein [Megasphaera stantonii]|uniref:hypothetical protein n=2 Tax=Megasphaera TaxID=906 RepID=UPI00320AD67A
MCHQDEDLRKELFNLGNSVDTCNYLENMYKILSDDEKEKYAFQNNFSRLIIAGIDIRDSKTKKTPLIKKEWLFLPAGQKQISLAQCTFYSQWMKDMKEHVAKLFNTDTTQTEKVRKKFCLWIIKLNYRTESNNVRVRAYKKLRKQLDKIMKKTSEIMSCIGWEQRIFDDAESPLIFDSKFKELIKIPFSLPIIGVVHGGFLLEFYLEYVNKKELSILYSSKEFWALYAATSYFSLREKDSTGEIKNFNQCKKRISSRSSERKEKMKDWAAQLWIYGAFAFADKERYNIPRRREVKSVTWEMEPLDEWTIINNLFEYINFEWNDTAPYVSVDWQKGPAFNTKCKSSFENALKNPQHSLFSDFIYSRDNIDKPVMEEERLQYVFFRSELIRMNLKSFINELYQQDLCFRMLKNKYIGILAVNNIYSGYIFRHILHPEDILDTSEFCAETTEAEFDAIIKDIKYCISRAAYYFPICIAMESQNMNFSTDAAEVKESFYHSKSVWKPMSLILLRQKLKTELYDLQTVYSLPMPGILLDDEQYAVYCDLVKQFATNFKSILADDEALTQFVKSHKKELSILTNCEVVKLDRKLKKIRNQLRNITGNEFSNRFFLEYFIAYVQLAYGAQSDRAKEIKVEVNYYKKKRGKEFRSLYTILHQEGNFSEIEIAYVKLLMDFQVFCNRRLEIIFLKSLECRRLMIQLLLFELDILDCFPLWEGGIIRFEDYNMNIFQENLKNGVLIMPWFEDYTC